MYVFIYLLAALGLRCCTRAFSSSSERGLLFVVVRRLLIAVASLVVEHGLSACRLSSCGAQVLLLRGMWDLPGPGIEPVSPALAGGFLTTVPPGKPSCLFLKRKMFLPRHTEGRSQLPQSLYHILFPPSSSPHELSSPGRPFALGARHEPVCVNVHHLFTYKSGPVEGSC